MSVLLIMLLQDARHSRWQWRDSFPSCKLEIVHFSWKWAGNRNLESIRQTHFDPIVSGNIGTVSSTGTGSRFTTPTHTDNRNVVPQASIKSPIFIHQHWSGTHRHKFNCPNDPLLAERNHFIKKGSNIPNGPFSCCWLKCSGGLGIAEMSRRPRTDPAQCQISLGDL